MSTGHDKPCTNCKGTGERLITEPFQVAPEMRGQDMFKSTQRIVECMICLGTGLVEVDEYWEHG